MIDPADVSVELEQDSRRANFVDDSEFADWDFNAGDAPAVEASADISRRVVGSTLESYAARRRGRVVTVDDANDVASVKWLENDPFAHALVRRLTLATEIDENAKPTKTTAFFPGESLSLGSAVEGFQVPLVPGDNDLKAAVLRADVWPFDQRRQAVVKALDRMRIPHAVGRVELKVRRETCYRSALKGYRDLGLRAWRMGWFINFHRESGLDAGGLSREFWRLTLAHAFSEEAGLFARTENGSYDCVDAIEDEIKERLPEYRFVGRCLGKLLFDRHSGCLEAAVNVKIFKLLVGEPVVFDDLQLVDEQLWLSLTKLEALSNNNPDRLSDLELNFAVDRRSFLSGRSSTVELEPGGADVLVDADNIDRFLEARMREVLFDKHKDQLLALLAGFHDICPPSVLLLLTARELELALCGEQHVDMEDWKANTVYRGAFETEKADHPVCAAFWRTVESWSDQRRTRLLQWSIGTARLPLGGFRNLQQRDGVSRQFTLTSVDPSNAIYPRSHTCFNRIDLPLYANPEREVPNALEFVVTHATAEFTLD